MTQVNFTDKEYAFLKEYADSLGLTVSEMLWNTVNERIEEDEEDRRMCEEAYAQFVADGKQTISFEELMKELNE